MKNSLNLNRFHTVFSTSSAGGLCLLWDKDVGVQLIASSNIDWEGFSWRFTGFYGFPELSKKKLSWDLIRDLNNFSNLTWVIGGDFNEILWCHEKEGGAIKDNDSMQSFRDCFNDCNLQDLGYHGDIYTWSNRRRANPLVFERLDHFLGNQVFFNLFGYLSVKNLEWAKSDHKAIELCCGSNIFAKRKKKSETHIIYDLMSIGPLNKIVVKSSPIVPTEEVVAEI